MRADSDRTVARGRPHTVGKGMRARSYDELSQDGIIHNKRGIGYFVSPGARGIIRERQRGSFISEELKEVFRKMDILGITIEDIVSLYRKHSRQQQTTADNSRQQQ